MAVEISPATDILPVAGLTKALSRADLAVSHDMYGRPILSFETLQMLTHKRHRYNDLPYIGDQEKPRLLSEATALIARHGMGKSFRPHLAHRHDLLDSGTIRFETKIQGTPYTLTKPINTDRVDFSNIHPACFKVIENSLVAFEFAEGQVSLDTSKISEFFHEWVNFLNKNELTDLISLDCGSFEPDDEPATEIELQFGGIAATMKVPISACTRVDSTDVPTGWTACNPEAGDSTPPAGQHWNEATKPDGTKTHKVHVDGLSSAPSPNALVDALVRQGVLRAS